MKYFGRRQYRKKGEHIYEIDTSATDTAVFTAFNFHFFTAIFGDIFLLQRQYKNEK